ncbi:MAG: hypothetical protein AAFQ85_10770 [Pseudomonadota bacterium]
MTRRALSSVTPFGFSPTFEPQTAGPVTLETGELSAMLAEARAQGAADALQGAEDAAALAAARERLSETLADLSAIARHLSAEASTTEIASDVRRLTERALKQLEDGQRDLFSGD